MTRLDSLTGLRFAAAFYVCVFHSTHGLTPFGWLNDIHSAGYTAVGLFFVLSGYVLAHANAESVTAGEFDSRGYLLKRMARIAPLHWLALLGSLAITWVISGELPGVFQFAACVLFLSTWLGAAEVNIPAWSLTCEVFFYLTFERFMRLAQRLDDRAAVYASLACFGISLAISGTALLVVGPEVRFVEWHPLARLPEFVLGILAWRCSQGRFATFVSPNARVWGALVVIVAVLANSSSFPRILLHNTILMLPFAVLIDGLARGGGALLQKLLASKTMVLLGEASFALYIFQMVVEQTVNHLLSIWGLDHWPRSIVWRIVLIAASIAIYRYVETPVRRLITRNVGKAPKPGASAPAAAVPPAA